MSQIERLRQRMYEVVNIYGIASQQAIIESQHVDDVLNQYNRLQIKIEEIAS